MSSDSNVLYRVITAGYIVTAIGKNAIALIAQSEHVKAKHFILQLCLQQISIRSQEISSQNFIVKAKKKKRMIKQSA